MMKIKFEPFMKHLVSTSAILFALMISLAVIGGDRQILPLIFTVPVYNQLAKYDSTNDLIVLKITDFCKDYPNLTQVECVVKQINYSYVERDDIKIKSLTELSKDGGVCRDIAVAEAAIFRNLGYKVYYRVLTNHVYISVESDEIYCNIDGEAFDCLVW